MTAINGQNVSIPSVGLNASATKVTETYGQITNTELVDNVNNAHQLTATIEENANTKMGKRFACK